MMLNSSDVRWLSLSVSLDLKRGRVEAFAVTAEPLEDVNNSLVLMNDEARWSRLPIDISGYRGKQVDRVAPFA